MVNAKNYAFKVLPQLPNSQASTQSHGTVINCRKPASKRAARDPKEGSSHHVPVANLEDSLKRKRVEEEECEPSDAVFSRFSTPTDGATTTRATSPDRSVGDQQRSPPKQLRPRKIKPRSKGVDLDSWFTILSFSDPAQLLEMRRGIPSCYYFLRDNPMLWKHSRNYHYGSDLPEPPSELTEFQYADLRHDHACMSCKTPSTRKTYWAFLRRWCKTCLQSKTIREHDAMVQLRSAHGEDHSFLSACLPAGIFDSWGNFVGVGPASTHALKTVYLSSDVRNIVTEYNNLRAENKDPDNWEAEVNAWFGSKVRLVEERRQFAKEMESWEELMRNARSQDYTSKKAARKKYFQAKAAELDPPISAKEMDHCPSYGRAIRIPKDPNSASWLQLKPKLEKEAAAWRAKSGAEESRPTTSSNSGTSTPVSVMSAVDRPQPTTRQYMPPPSLPSIGHTLGYHPGLTQLHRPRPPTHGLPIAPHYYASALPRSQGPALSHSQALAPLQSHGFTPANAQRAGPAYNQPQTFATQQSQSSVPSHRRAFDPGRPPHSHMF
jgi:hypothetical protein